MHRSHLPYLPLSFPPNTKAKARFLVLLKNLSFLRCTTQLNSTRLDDSTQSRAWIWSRGFFPSLLIVVVALWNVMRNNATSKRRTNFPQFSGTMHFLKKSFLIGADLDSVSPPMPLFIMHFIIIKVQNGEADEEIWQQMISCNQFFIVLMLLFLSQNVLSCSPLRRDVERRELFAVFHQ